MTQVAAKRRALVFGDDTRAFLTVVRSLGREGIEVHAVPFERNSPSLYSRYIKHIHTIPAFDQTSAWIDAIKKLLSLNSFDILIPCCDRSLLCLDKYRDELEQQCIALPGQLAIKTLFDKFETRNLAEACSVPVPDGRLLDVKDTTERLLEEFSLPLLLKKRRSYTLRDLKNRGQVHLVRSPGQLEALLKSITRHEEYIVEAYFEGAGLGVSILAEHGKLCCAFQHLRLREPREGGGSSLRVSEDLNPKMVQCCRDMARAVNLNGVAMFEFRVERSTGEFVLIEVNGRFWGSIPLPVALGVNFPYFVFKQAVLGEQVKQVDYQSGVVARNLVINTYDVLLRNSNTNFRFLMRLAADLFDLACHPINLIRGKEISDTFQRDDLRPAFVELLQVPAIVSKEYYRRRVRPMLSNTRLLTTKSMRDRQSDR